MLVVLVERLAVLGEQALALGAEDVLGPQDGEAVVGAQALEYAGRDGLLALVGGEADPPARPASQAGVRGQGDRDVDVLLGRVVQHIDPHAGALQGVQCGREVALDDLSLVGQARPAGVGQGEVAGDRGRNLRGVGIGDPVGRQDHGRDPVLSDPPQRGGVALGTACGPAIERGAQGLEAAEGRPLFDLDIEDRRAAAHGEDERRLAMGREGGRHARDQRPGVGVAPQHRVRPSWRAQTAGRGAGGE